MRPLENLQSTPKVLCVCNYNRASGHSDQRRGQIRQQAGREAQAANDVKLCLVAASFFMVIRVIMIIMIIMVILVIVDIVVIVTIIRQAGGEA